MEGASEGHSRAVNDIGIAFDHISICMAKLPSNRCENTWHVYEEENEEHACRHVLQIKDASSTVGNSP